jgi:hypothetical protein
MTSRIRAIQAYCPRLMLKETMSTKGFMTMITQRSTLSSGVVKNVHDSEIEALMTLLLEGTPVHTEAAIYTPSIDLDGRIEVKVRLNPQLSKILSAAGQYHGKIINAESIGKSADELVALWNAEHPNDPVA